MEFLYKFCFGLTTCLGIAQGLLVLYKNPRSRVNVTWALTSFVVAIWSLEMSYFFESNYERALLGSRIANYAAVFIPVLFTHFCLALLNKPLRESPLTIAGYVFAISLGAFVSTPLFIPSVSPKLVFRHYVNPGPLYIVFTTFFFTLAFYAHWRLFRHLHAQSLKQQNQIKWVASATITGFVCGSTTFLAVYDIPFNPWPSLFTFVYTLIITYAIIKHQLLDIKVAVTRTGVLLATYLIILGLPFVVGWWGKGWLRQRVGEEWWLVPLGLCTALATVGPFVYAALRRQAEARLLKDQRRYQRTLQLAARGMTRVRDLKKLTRLIVRVICRTVRVQHATLFLWDQERQHYTLAASHGPQRFAVGSLYRLERTNALPRRLLSTKKTVSRDDLVQVPTPGQLLETEMARISAALVVPGFMEEELAGFLALGEKRSGEPYSMDDLHAFATLTHEATIAIENARSYEELLKANEELRLARDRFVEQARLAAAGEFATGMAHEIKNPLSSIKTFAAYLPEKYRDPDFREKFFRIVQGEIDRINTIVRDLLDFAKPDKPQLEPVSVSELAQDTLTLLSNRVLKQGVAVRTRFQENGLQVQADEKQLKQAVLNLLLNSLDAMPDGGRLEVGTSVTNQWLTLRIVDSGCGIPDDTMRRVFDPFFTTKERGVGLGLPIVKGVIERHGGELFLRSTAGQGTTVEIMLPVIGRGPTQ